MATYIVLLGPPGAGKGTQAGIVSTKLGIPHISTGDLFRENIRNRTELGAMAKQYTDRGELVPDDVTVEIVRERLSRADCAGGALLDGFPRTPVQAEALNRILHDLGGAVKWVPYINVPAEELIERLAARWTCRKDSNHIYNLKFNPPVQPGVCDVDGGELYQRDDDKPETVKNRIEVYFNQTRPLIDFYAKAGVLVEVNGMQPIEKVGADLLEQMSNQELE
jgi:adenylate kinase